MFFNDLENRLQVHACPISADEGASEISSDAIRIPLNNLIEMNEQETLAPHISDTNSCSQPSYVQVPRYSEQYAIEHSMVIQKNIEVQLNNADNKNSIIIKHITEMKDT